MYHKQAECLQPLVTPPFAALDYSTEAALYTVFTMGGLHTTPTGQVLTADGEPVVPYMYCGDEYRASFDMTRFFPLA